MALQVSFWFEVVQKLSQIQAIAFLVSFAGLDCTNLISTYPEDDPEEINKSLKKKLMLGVGIINIVCAVLLAVGVSYFAATVLEEFYSYEQVRFSISYLCSVILKV